MLLPNQVFNIRINASSIKHYQEKGYKNLTVNCFCDIKAEDLSKGAKSNVQVECDYCSKVFSKSFQKYFKQRKTVQKDACYECFGKKQKESAQLKHGCEYTPDTEESKAKRKATNLERFGFENLLMSPIVREKFKTTMNERYGCDYSQQNAEIKAKTQKVFLDKYGVKSPLGSQIIRKKYQRNLKFVNGVMVSKLQIAIADYLKGSLNVIVSNFYVDILLENKTVIEYNGGGHRLKVQYGLMTNEAFEKKEEERIELLNKMGYKVFVINNSKNIKVRFGELRNKIDSFSNGEELFSEYYVS